MQISHPQFLLVTLIPRHVSDEELLKDLEEVKSLVETYGGEVRGLVVQRREIHEKGMFIGRGKLVEVQEAVSTDNIDVVVLNDIVKPGHIYEIQSVLETQNHQIKVWDKVDLILEIFAKHAQTSEAKLQIELASMKHMGPRIYGMGFVMSRQGGGIGTLGVGETNTELMKRHWRDQIKKTQDKIKKHSFERSRQIERRSKNGVQTVSLVGYTNAGKTSLFNTLTGKKNIVQNALFVTLDSSTGKVFLPQMHKEILVSDTIGFIKNLPPDLIDAFKSTLMEALFADIILHVIDISDPEWEKKVVTVEHILYELKIEHKKKIYVFNKIDATASLDKTKLAEEYKEFDPQFVSVRREQGITELISSIEKALTDLPSHNKKPKERRVKVVHV